MNKHKILYFLSLFLFAVAFFLLVSFSESGRMCMIAGMLVPIAFGLNILSYSIVKGQKLK